MADENTTQPQPVDVNAIVQQLMAQNQLPQPDTTPVKRSFTSLLGEALGGGDPGLGGFSPTAREAAGTRALLNFGMGMLSRSGYSAVPQTLGEAIATGLGAAGQSETGSAEAAYTALGQRQKMAMDQQNMRINALKEALPYLQFAQQQQALQAMRGGGGGGPGTNNVGNVGADIYSLPKEEFLKAVAQRESGGDPTVLNYVAREDPTAFARGATASGKYQMVVGTWRTAAKLAGIDTDKYPEARYAPEALQDKAASALYDAQGTAPWNPAKFGANWVRGNDGKYQLVQGAPYTPPPGRAAAPAAPAAPGTTTSAPPAGPPGTIAAGTATPAAPSAPGVPPPPGGAPGASTGPYTGGGIGAALTPNGLPPAQAAELAKRTGQPVPVVNADGTRSQLTAQPDGTLRDTPSPALSGKKTADIIQGGMLQAQATPRPPGTGEVASTAPIVPPQPPAAAPAAQPGWGTVAGNYNTGPAAAAAPAPAAPPAAVTPPAQEPKPPAPPDFQMRPLTPTEQAATSYELDPAMQANFARRKAGAVTVEQMQAILKEEADAVAARRKEADAARLKIEETARKDWQGQTHPSTDVELQRAGIPRQPGVQYMTDNQGQVTTKAVPVDPRQEAFSRAEGDRYQKNYAAPYDNVAPVRAMLGQLSALEPLVQSDRLGQGTIGADYARKLNQALISAGFASPGLTESTAAQEAYRGISNQLILRLKAASGTSLGQMSDRDLSFVESAAPNLQMTPHGREILAASLRQILDHQERVYEAATTTIHDPAGGYTLGNLPKALRELPDAIPTSPGPGATKEERGAWMKENRVRRGTAYYGADGNMHLWGVPEPQQ